MVVSIPVPEYSLGDDRIFAIEDITGATLSAMWCEIIVLTVEIDHGFLADSAHHRSSTVRRECRWHELVRFVL